MVRGVGRVKASVTRCRRVVAFGVNDMATAKMLSERIGPTTVVARSAGVSQRYRDVVPERMQAGQSEAGRPLIDPSEIVRLGTDEVLVFMSRRVAAPVKARRVRYFEERRFDGQYDAWRDTALHAARSAVTATPVQPLVVAGPLAEQLSDAAMEIAEMLRDGEDGDADCDWSAEDLAWMTGAQRSSESTPVCS